MNAFPKDELLALAFEYLAIPSISADKENREDLERASQFVKKLLDEIGFKTSILPGSDPKVVLGQLHGDGKKRPTLLFYGHYDVQPVTPIEQWRTPPFSPTLIADRIYARGAQDNKGQFLYLLCALKHFLSRFSKAKLPFEIKVLCEGDEEVGSVALSALLKKGDAELIEALSADLLLLVDAGSPSLDMPALEVGLRGLVTFDLELSNGFVDHHSGLFGGIVANPLLALAKLLSKMVDEKGRVLIPGFYEGVKALSKEEHKLFYFDFDEKVFKKETGVGALGGESEFPVGERASLRPTFEVNGLWGGYNESGFKTVIPASAFAKISCRLVSEQDPEKIAKSFQDFAQHLCPEGFTLKVKKLSCAKASFSKIDNPYLKMARRAYSRAFGKEAELTLGGGSIPIAAAITEKLKMPFVAMGFGLNEDLIHAPNESFSLSQMEHGFRAILAILETFYEENS